MDERIISDTSEAPKSDPFTLAEKMMGRIESFPYPGIKEQAYLELKATSEEFPEYTTHIDEIIKRFETEGIQVVVTGGVNVYALPSGDEITGLNIENNGIFLKFLTVNDDMEKDLKILISGLQEVDSARGS